MLIDSDEIENQNKSNKLKKALIILIVIFSIISMSIAGAIYYMMQNSDEKTARIDGIKVNGLANIIDMQTDEQGNVKMYFPIRDFAKYLNQINTEQTYKDYTGGYEANTEDKDKCHVVLEKKEVTIYSNNSKKIYKKNLENNNSEYEIYNIDEDIFINNEGELYASQEGIETGYNVYISYDSKKKAINIYTLDKLISNQNDRLAQKKYANYGTVSIDVESFNNTKSIFLNKIIVNEQGKKYGIIDLSTDNFILEPKYDNITFLPDTQCFLIKLNNKFGLFDKDGKSKISLDLGCEEITSMGQDSGLYVVKRNKLYGIVDSNGKTILYPQYDQIGIDMDNFAHNDVKNGYILLDKLIPVKQGNRWALFDQNGKMISDGFKYSEIGCSRIKNSSNSYPVLQIAEKNLIVVKFDTKYGFMDTSGNDNVVPNIIDEVYLKEQDGKNSYYISYLNGKELDIMDYLEKKQ